jgi:hypothetical protein
MIEPFNKIRKESFDVHCLLLPLPTSPLLDLPLPPPPHASFGSLGGYLRVE